ncbi:MAG: hypothetical protein ACOYB8_08840 [Eubacteriaceae bacterium]|jgi:2,4-dienoyl-CoA reductase-like NADH-dependent reductase (Old Yellow Enzyme family)
MKNTIFKPAKLGALTLDTRILTVGRRFDAMLQDNTGSGAVIAGDFVPCAELAVPDNGERTMVLSDQDIFIHKMYLQMKDLCWTPVFAGLMHPGPGAQAGQPLELPSVISGKNYGREAQRISTSGCEVLASEFATAAAAAKAAGYSGVCIDMSCHTLLGAFLSPELNQRADKYGGSVFKRMRLPAETITAVREKQLPEFSIIVSFSVAPCGRSVEEMLLQIAFLEEAGADAILLDYEGEGDPELTQRLREACDVPVIRRPEAPTFLAGMRLVNNGLADFALV